MIKLIHPSVSAALSLVAIQFAFTSASVSYAQSGSSSVDQVSAMKKPEHKVAEAERMVLST